MKLYHCLIVTAIATSGGASEGHADHAARGALLRSVALGHLEPDEIRTRLQNAGADASAVRLSIDLYRLEYRTIDAQQNPTTASGLVAVPDDHARASVAISFTHGTELSRDGAPSRALGSAAASSRHAALASSSSTSAIPITSARTSPARRRCSPGSRRYATGGSARPTTDRESATNQRETPDR